MLLARGTVAGTSLPDYHDYVPTVPYRTVLATVPALFLECRIAHPLRRAAEGTCGD